MSPRPAIPASRNDLPRRAARLALSVCVATLVMLASAPALARDTRFDVVATGALGIDPNDRCTRRSLDTVDCTATTLNGTLELSFEGRPLPWLGLGGFFGLSRVRLDEPESSAPFTMEPRNERLLRVGAELRVHPFQASLPGAWLGATGGYAKLQGGAEQQGALVGISLGVDFTLLRWLLLGVGARAEYLALGSSGGLLSGLSVGESRYESGLRLWLGARVGVTF